MHYTCVPQYSELGVGVPYLDVSLTCACLYIAASQCQHKGSKLKVDFDTGFFEKVKKCSTLMLSTFSKFSLSHHP